MRKLLLCTVFLLLATTLVAKEAVLRVGYLSSLDFENLDEVIISCTEQVLSYHDDLSSFTKDRILRESEKEYQEKVHAALKNDNWQNIARKDEKIATSKIETIKLEFEFWNKKELLCDEAEHIIRTNSLDLLLCVTGENDGSLLDYSISIFSLNGNVHLVDTLAILHKLDDEKEKLIKALSNVFLPQYSYIKLNNQPSNLLVTVDGIAQDVKASLVFLKPGHHTLRFSSINKLSQDIEVETQNGEIKELDLIFHSLTFPPFELTTIPASAKINIQGMDGYVGHYKVSEQPLPLAINCQMDGFADLNLQINKPLLASTLELRPKWMDNDERVKNAKVEMYKALRNTLLSFGSYVLISSLENIYSAEFRPYSAPIKLTFSSISIISLLDFLYKSGKYYHTAEQTYY